MKLGSAETLTRGTERLAKETNLEDGEFYSPAEILKNRE